jgi:protease-4
VASKRGVWLVVIFIVIAVVVSAAGLILTAFFVGGQPSVQANSVLMLRVGGDLGEVEPGGLVGSFLEPAPTVRSVVDALRKAKADRRVTGVIIRPTSTAALWGKVQEVRDAILDFKTSKKPIIAYLEYGGEQEFYLATACDQVFLMPTASLDLTGMASYELFLRGTLDKIGAYPDALHIGDYKTASNTFTERTYTPAHREMAESLNRDLYEQLVKGIAEGRRKTEAEVRQMIDHGPYLPEDAVRAGLVDDVGYEDELDDKVRLECARVRWWCRSCSAPAPGSNPLRTPARATASGASTGATSASPSTRSWTRSTAPTYASWSLSGAFASTT